ncbi:MAG: class I SAM-dependent methyltransferase [Acidimicrobiales bacterium]
MTATRRRRKLAKSATTVPFWFHSVDLGDDVVTDGRKSADRLAAEWRALGVPDLRGKTVLDVGAWDGWFSFRAEQQGASRVVAVDHYAWSIDQAAQQRYWRECRTRGETPRPSHEVPELWRPDELPGKAGFDTAHRALESRVESVVGDIMTMNLDRLGTFDVVLFLGVLRHMRHPLLALERLAKVTSGVLIVETDAVAVPGFEHHAFCEFLETDELGSDVNIWWVPNRHAVEGLCRAAGFARVQSPDDGRSRPPSRESLHRYPLVVKAWKRAGSPAAGGSASPPLPG